MTIKVFLYIITNITRGHPVVGGRRATPGLKTLQCVTWCPPALSLLLLLGPQSGLGPETPVSSEQGRRGGPSPGLQLQPSIRERGGTHFKVTSSQISSQNSIIHSPPPSTPSTPTPEIDREEIFQTKAPLNCHDPPQSYTFSDDLRWSLYDPQQLQNSGFTSYI